MTEMLVRYDGETPVHDAVLDEVQAAHDWGSRVSIIGMQKPQGTPMPSTNETEQTVALAEQAAEIVSPDMRTWGMDFVCQTTTQAVERPNIHTENSREFDTSTLAGAQQYLLAVVAGRYGMQGAVAPFRYAGNARAIDERNAQSLFGRIGSNFRTQSF